MPEEFAYLNESLSAEQRIEDLITRLTIDEKIARLVNFASEIPRLGVREYDWWNEALHGVARAGEATVFPQAIGLAATFDTQLLYKIAQVIAQEARAKYNRFQQQEDYGIYKGLTFWSPNINIFRDPRWGRGHETYGEDPFLSGRLGCAFVKGLQQTDGKHMKAAACAKHFAAHSGPEKGRHSFNSEVKTKDLYETYLPAFEELVCEAQVEAVMGAYNALNGVPCCANEELLINILRERWGFKGHVVSDCGAIADIWKEHKTVDTPAEAAALALKSGCDLNCGYTYESLIDAYEQDLVEESDFDKALRRLFNTQFKLGMFDKACSYNDISYEKNACTKHKELSLEASRRSMVLLKNDGLLPLRKKTIGRLALIGPNANSEQALLGNYHGTPTDYYTPLRGLQEFLGEEAVLYAKGAPLFGEGDEALLNEAKTAAAGADVCVLCLGLDAKIEGEDGDVYNPDFGGDKADLQLPASQQQLLEEISKQGKPLVVVLLSGSALALNYAHERAQAIVQAWYPGEQGGKALAELLFGEFSPSGRLPVTFYKSEADLEPFTDYSMKNRTYRYFRGEPLYPFGFGLSYTRFKYSGIKAIKNEPYHVTLTFKLQNTGKADSHEITQVYVSRQGAGEDYPIWELKGLCSTFLKAGEETFLKIELPKKAFSYITKQGERINTAGGYDIYIGSCQPDERSKQLCGGQTEKTYIVLG